MFDYNAVATRRWLAIVAAGSVSGVAALWLAARDPRLEWPLLVAAIVAIGAMAAFPLRIPRTKYTIGAADIFVFAVLALHGVPAAILAAGVEALVIVWRTSQRLTSRLSAPTAAMAGMALSGLVFGVLHEALRPTALGAGAALMIGLTAASGVYFATTTLPLIAVLCAKSGQRLSLTDWANQYGWVGAIYLCSAAVASVLAMNTRHFGWSLLFVAAAIAMLVLALVNRSLNYQERERAEQEARLGEAQREAQFNQQRFLAAFKNAAIGMAIVRPDGAVHQVNLSLCRLLGRDESGLLGEPFQALLHPADVELFQRRAPRPDAALGTTGSLELRCVHTDGSEIWVSLHASPFTDPAQDRAGMIYQLHDITSRRQAEGQLHHVAYHDGLTDLANRNCFHERLSLTVEHSRLDPKVLFAVLFLDLDRFKVVNDSLGHGAGNHLLREVALRLRACVRPQDLVARLGGDEFVILLEGLHDADDGRRLAERVLQSVSAPLTINGTEVLPGASLGLTFSDLGYRTAEEMLRDADVAMYEAKAAGRGRVALFDNSMHARVAEKLALENDLRHAIGDGMLSLQFQPIYELVPQRLCGFEALVRWTHPTRGVVSPAVFVALAEESGIIEALTRWVLDQAVAQLVQWRRAEPLLPQLSINVNVSSRDLASGELPAYVRTVLARHTLPPEHLTLEITETTMMSRLDAVRRDLTELRALGVKFSIDDFGTGYSSLAYLSTLPIDSLKIDRSFVIGLANGPQNAEIVRAVTTLGAALGRNVVAEGIETSEQLESLRDLGVRFGQGYLLSRPLTPPQGAALLRIASLQLEGVDRMPATAPADAATPVGPATTHDTLIAAGTVT